jgi:hypothetical protein
MPCTVKAITTGEMPLQCLAHMRVAVVLSATPLHRFAAFTCTAKVRVGCHVQVSVVELQLRTYDYSVTLYAFATRAIGTTVTPERHVI